MVRQRPCLRGPRSLLLPLEQTKTASLVIAFAFVFGEQDSASSRLDLSRLRWSISFDRWRGWFCWLGSRRREKFSRWRRKLRQHCRSRRDTLAVILFCARVVRFAREPPQLLCALVCRRTDVPRAMCGCLLVFMPAWWSVCSRRSNIAVGRRRSLFERLREGWSVLAVGGTDSALIIC